MKKDYTHISVILDRSGSMEALREEIIGGYNGFIEEQKKLQEKATVTLAQFDNVDPYEVVYNFRDLQDIEPLTKETYSPRGMTPLLDAIGKGINDIESGINNLPVKPDKIILMIITDGQENSSKEFKKDTIKKMIQEKEKDWEVVFLSSDLNSINDAGSYGISTYNTSIYTNTSRGVRNLFDSVTNTTSNYRMGKSVNMNINVEEDTK